LNIKEHQRIRKFQKQRKKVICLLLQVMTSYQENKQKNRLLECWVRHYTTY